jgi:D-3-phosphoglycerate dehydrogenase
MMPPKVLCLVPRIRFENAGVRLPAELEFHFAKADSEQELIAASRGMDFLLLPAAFPPITRNVLENIPTVRMLQSAGTGYDKVDIQSAAELKIPVANSPGANVTAVAEVVIAMLIALQRRMLVADREIKAGLI